MAKEETIEVEGRVKEALANTQFRVELDLGREADDRPCPDSSLHGRVGVLPLPGRGADLRPDLRDHQRRPGHLPE